MSDALVIGAGPAGLMAAEQLARTGLSVTVAEAKPSPARKLLMAGKSGLNLTRDETFESFLAAYGERAEALHPMLAAFGPQEVKAWAEGLGQAVFTGSSGRVFPRAMKASPLLRAWLGRLDGLGVELKTRWHWRGWDDSGAVCFDTASGKVAVTPGVTILACGGASWARLGSDGAWAGQFGPEKLAPFQPANMGFVVNWSAHMQRHFGAPVKNVILKAGDVAVRAEFTISSRGLEGGGIYAVSRAMRDGAALTLDLLPDLDEDRIRARMGARPARESLSNRLRKALRLDPVKQALLNEFARPLPGDPAPILKALPIRHAGPRPLDEAISTAGGLRFDALDQGLMLADRPGTFTCGEMLDWEAPTGGYLLTACLATGRWAGRHAAAFADRGAARVRP